MAIFLLELILDENGTSWLTSARVTMNFGSNEASERKENWPPGDPGISSPWDKTSLSSYATLRQKTGWVRRVSHVIMM